MKATIMFLLLFAASSVFAQDSTLVQVTTVKPYAKHRMDFEKSVKTHVAKFHPKKYPLEVYEILSGPRLGSYYLVNPMASWADLDKERPDHIAHEADINNLLEPWVMEDQSRDYYRYVDSLSHPTMERAPSLLFYYYYPKPGKRDELLAEARRGALVNNKINSPFGYTTHVKQLFNLNSVIVQIHTLKNGFSELEPEYMSAHNKQFKDAYIEMFGQDQWDRRMTLLPTLCDKVETELVKFRTDLSTKM